MVCGAVCVHVCACVCVPPCVYTCRHAPPHLACAHPAGVRPALHGCAVHVGACVRGVSADQTLSACRPSRCWQRRAASPPLPFSLPPRPPRSRAWHWWALRCTSGTTYSAGWCRPRGQQVRARRRGAQRTRGRRQGLGRASSVPPPPAEDALGLREWGVGCGNVPCKLPSIVPCDHRFPPASPHPPTRRRRPAAAAGPGRVCAHLPVHLHRRALHHRGAYTQPHLHHLPRCTISPLSCLHTAHLQGR